MQAQSGAPQAQPSFWRKLRKVLDVGLPVGGTLIIAGVVFLKHQHPEMAFVLVGVLMIEVGILKLVHKLLPNERKYHALRAQAEQFLKLVRQLNTAALRVQANDTPENREAVEEIRQSMQLLVERMIAVAGKTNATLSAEAQLAQQNRYVSTVS